jgi:hypothetical protein
MFGPSIERTVKARRHMLEVEFAGRSADLEAACAELNDAMSRFEAASGPDDLLG